MSTSYKTWGADGIDENSHLQMMKACELPMAVGAALMPDAHLGYGLPIGGVLALDNAVCPYAVGVDIACRMKVSYFDIDPATMMARVPTYARILEENTFFGVGVENRRGYMHPVFGRDWGVSIPTSENFDKAVKQIGTSGSGNHFVEFGVVSWPDRTISGAGKRCECVALMSHSGSRGVGAAVCSHFSKIAKDLNPEWGDLGWLELGTTLGDQYWDAMNLMGEYASANHELIHRAVADALNMKPWFTIENHHNFAWKEQHNGREVVVHRKGATPAGEGVMGVIPGSMGTPAYIVRGKGNADSLCSASHGAGRVMSRKQAKKTFNYRTEIDKLAAQGIHVISAGADEVCGVYKDIDAVMAAQTDLVEVMAKFEPKIVKMCGSNDRAED